MLSKEKKLLLQKFANQSDKLFSLGIIRTDSFTGEIGEYIASEQFGFEKTDRVTRAIDGIDKNGKKYQVKAKAIETDKVNYAIQKIDLGEIDYLVIVYFDLFYTVRRIIRIHSNQLSGENVNISNRFLDSVKYEEFKAGEIIISEKNKVEIFNFGKLYESLKLNGIIRSRRIVGDLGEFYASQYLNLTLNENRNEKGVDAYDKNGIKYEIKTRRVYQSGRRTGKSRRLNNLVGKDSEFLVIVALDRSFDCAGMWLMPMKNVTNPKSAHLQIVNTTKGVKKIVESKIEWLN